ncbi:MAG: radical SAM protein [Acidobacteriota bacterium]
MEPRLRIHEIYRSLQGETRQSGRPCTFVRLTGCDLRCHWCDTPQAFVGGRWWSLDEIVAEVERLGAPFVTVTGGEPLLQAESCAALVARLLDAGHDVQVETGGHRDVSVLDRRARIICDLKAPGSGESDKIDWDNLDRLRADDEIKIVVASREDFDWAVARIDERLGELPATTTLQPATGTLEPVTLADWMLERPALPARFGLQLHALLWPGQEQR